MAHSHDWPVHVGFWWEASVLHHVELSTGLFEYPQGLTVCLPQSKGSMREQGVSSDVLWSGLGSQTAPLYSNLFIVWSVLTYGGKGTHKGVSTRRRGSGETSWRLIACFHNRIKRLGVQLHSFIYGVFKCPSHMPALC